MSGKLRIVLVANTTWNIFNFRLNVIQKLVDEGHQVFVLAPVDEYIEYKEKFPTVTHIGLKNLDRDSTNPVKDFLLLAELYRKYKKIKPSLVIHYTHKPNIFGSLAARYARIPTMNVVTGLGYAFIHKGWINFLIKLMYRMAGRKTELTVFENQDDLSLFIQEGLVSQSRAISIKGCGVDATYFVPQPNGQVHENLTFTFIGRLLKDKGVREFAEAAEAIKKNYPSTHFVMLGDFDEENPSTIDRDQLLQWLNEETVDYRGFVRDVRPYLAKSDCIILPSYREGLPRIILEGMAMGKAIITTDTAGCRETVKNGLNGFLVQPRNTTSLIEGIEKFISLSHESRKDMGQQGRQLVEQLFDSRIIADQLYGYIQRVLDNQPKKS